MTMIADIATIIALVAGPVVAVCVGRLQEERRAKKDRKWSILRDLMQSRKTQLSRERVSALNLIEIEFHDDKEIVDAWKKVLVFLYRVEPEDANEKLELYRKRDDKIVELLQLIASKLGVPLDPDDIRNNAYNPRGWDDLESEHEEMRRLTIKMLRGDTFIPVITFPPPPPPEDSQKENGGNKELEPPTHKS